MYIGTNKILRVFIIFLAIMLFLAIYLYYTNRTNLNPLGLTLYGNIEQRQISLAFNANERITELFVEEGDSVIKGQLLGKLDTRTIRQQIKKAQAQIKANEAALLRLKNGSRPQEIEQAKAVVNVAKADVEHKKKLYNRYTNIVKMTNGQGISKQNLDESRADYNASLATLDNKKLALELAEIGPRIEDINQAQAILKSSMADLAILNRQLEESYLIAPADAFVRARILEVGDMASSQKPVYTLALISPKWVRAYVPEADLGKIKQGMHANIISDSFPDTPIEGQVGFISSNAEFTPKYIQTEELRTALVYEIRIYVKDPTNQLKLGMPITVKLRD
ncbi:HlyD family efflux transporter periplasmic adaptor subunit [Entomomonas moraniae]|uniref:HlyD family efflux transporter periplasmic adaptor subunit n=1 Tax=Entomomonas moraniae TaxID=2213226 RepID=A0A3S9XCF9_9GAMM|nr:efflux RND transporter periplasmic adaptor subunit [Entomomonas moraniae]AZS50109.1 HlyD family efflux transporter periplasmic adaptor subunit [Entomomonas moraniae]